MGCDDSQAQWKQSGKAISTPAPTRGATWRASVGCSSFHILTPVPHAGRDKRLQANYQFTSCFNSHTQEGGTPLVDILPSQIRFQLTLPMRDATVREVRQDTADTLGLHLNFNSRTRVGYDSTPYVSHVERGAFQLPHPMRGATHNLAVLEKRMFISTPAPHEGCDWDFRATRPWLEFQLTHSMHGCDRHGRVWRRETCHFNSRTRVGCDKIKWYTNFNSRTHAGCDVSREYCNVFMLISIPAPRVGCDATHSSSTLEIRYFNSRALRGVRHHLNKKETPQVSISIHAPRVGCGTTTSH